MKRGLALLVAILCYFCTYSQEANAESRIPDFVVTPRFDANLYVPTFQNGQCGFDFGNTSLYTFLDGAIGNFSYSLCNHWLSEDPASLYRNAFLSYENDFIDWLTLSYAAGPVSFTIGKDVLAIGSSEFDYYDVDIHYSTASPFWHKTPVYQWGASIDFTTKNEDTTFRLQFATSPFGERPFASKMFTYSLYWTGEYGPFTPYYSVNLVEYERRCYAAIIGLGNRFYIGDSLTLDVDYMARSSVDEMTTLESFFSNEFSLSAQLLYNFEDRFEFYVKGGYDHSVGSDLFGYPDEFWFIPTDGRLIPKYWYAGGGVHYFPLRDSRDLRIHAEASYNDFARSVSVMLGATYHFNLTQTILKNRKK